MSKTSSTKGVGTASISIPGTTGGYGPAPIDQAQEVPATSSGQTSDFKRPHIENGCAYISLDTKIELAKSRRERIRKLLEK
jgi:hypothetical protein